jgi:hypothetical protein
MPGAATSSLPTLRRRRWPPESPRRMTFPTGVEGLTLVTHFIARLGGSTEVLTWFLKW